MAGCCTLSVVSLPPTPMIIVVFKWSHGVFAPFCQKSLVKQPRHIDCIDGLCKFRPSQWPCILTKREKRYNTEVHGTEIRGRAP